ncbi:hypothetical protein GAYE_SCF23G4281 [Galdieria yellowstonensis]|uniref:Uncharacterized protein n=1 Tax=Galdieria yellowstonensis TaxID=3028027 RepID=A0AAV9IG70_9RHOD|nr:hypothetical protein GAYE_SCF23G4281 [Galdieria yellowstonensis]
MRTNRIFIAAVGLLLGLLVLVAVKVWWKARKRNHRIDSRRSRQLFARDLELEIQRCKCLANGKNRATTTYRPNYLFQSSQHFSLSFKVLVDDILVQQLKQVVKSYLDNAVRYLKNNMMEQCREEVNNLLRFHRQWIVPALIDGTASSDYIVDYQTLLSKLKVRHAVESRYRWDIYRLYLEQYFASCGKQYSKSSHMENRKALQTYLGIHTEEALDTEEYVAEYTFKKAAVSVFENGVIHTERLENLVELERFLAFALSAEKTRAMWMETAKPFIFKYLWDIIRDQGITLQQAISKLSYLESTLNIELNTFFANLEEHESNLELQRKKRTLWKFWQSYKQGMKSRKDSFKAPPSSSSSSSEETEKP